MPPQSDVLVAMHEGVYRRQIAQLLYTQISGSGVPFDILVATPGDLEKHKENIGLIYRTATQKGREVYARPKALAKENHCPEDNLCLFFMDLY